MTLRQWIILFGTAIGLLRLTQGVEVLAPHWYVLTCGLSALTLTFVYARLTGISWLGQITRILDRRDR
jgi:hypothetical protein